MSKPETIEGEIIDINFPNRFFVLKNRDGAVFAKVQWTEQHEKCTRILKQKKGYYEKPVAELTSHEGIYNLVDLPWAERPADFPKSRGSKSYTGTGKPAGSNNAYIMVQTCYKEASENVRCLIMDVDMTFDENEFNRISNIAVTRAIADAKALMQAAKEMSRE